MIMCNGIVYGMKRLSVTPTAFHKYSIFSKSICFFGHFLRNFRLRLKAFSSFNKCLIKLFCINIMRFCKKFNNLPIKLSIDTGSTDLVIVAVKQRNDSLAALLIIRRYIDGAPGIGKTYIGVSPENYLKRVLVTGTGTDSVVLNTEPWFCPPASIADTTQSPRFLSICNGSFRSTGTLIINSSE